MPVPDRFRELRNRSVGSLATYAEASARSVARSTSLEKFKRKFPGYISRSIILHPGDLKVEGNLIHLPLYMAPFIPEIA